MNKDIEHLRLLAIFHYVLAGLAALGGCFTCLYIVIGMALVSGSAGTGPGPAEPAIGWMFVAIGTTFLILALAFAVGLAIAGRLLQRCRGYLFCMVMAAIACAWTPFGTILGVFTIFVLVRPSVKELFNRGYDPSLAIEEADPY
jgi:hypothetical protein